jgi:hypothetical protein
MGVGADRRKLDQKQFLILDSRCEIHSNGTIRSYTSCEILRADSHPARTHDAATKRRAVAAPEYVQHEVASLRETAPE